MCVRAHCSAVSLPFTLVSGSVSLHGPGSDWGLWDKGLSSLIVTRDSSAAVPTLAMPHRPQTFGVGPAPLHLCPASSNFALAGKSSYSICEDPEGRLLLADAGLGDQPQGLLEPIPLLRAGTCGLEETWECTEDPARLSTWLPEG